MFYPGSAGDANGVMGIASFENIIDPVLGYISSFSIDGGEDQYIGYLASSDCPNWPGTPLPVYATSLDPTVEDDACKPLPDDTPDLSGHAVLVRRGTCYFEEKAANILAKNGTYLLIYNNEPGFFAPNMDSASDKLNAGGMLLREQGEMFVAALKAGHNVTVTLISPTYSPGLFVTGSVGAPGGNILSTWTDNDYANANGTSMSTPMVASILALIAQVRGTFDPTTLRNLVSAYAKPQIWNDGERARTGSPAGAGFIQAHDAAYATTLLDPSSLSFNETAHFVKELSIKVTNSGEKEISYNISQVPALTMYTLDADGVYPMKFPNEIVEGHATLTFSEQQVTLMPGASMVISVSAQPPEGLDEGRLPVWSGYVIINGTDGSALSMPYQGLSGSMHTKAVLTWGHVGVASYKDKWFLDDGAEFILPGPGTVSDDILGIYANLVLGSPKVRCDIVPMTTCPPKSITVDDPLGDNFQTVGQPAGWPSSTSRGGNLSPWDGQLDSGSYIPPGKYKFVIRALRLFGDETKLEEWDKDTSTSFHIKYQT
ncbi:hypothetical protein ACCO45_001367 [Purpureocillium lilacinum]|uniref:Uncharacterized protein n=1 Tax=Purpureocillium lilacinum TaxID=33203 RepID=A0ACC4E7P8_PURLI